jgi:hypothetical protein
MPSMATAAEATWTTRSHGEQADRIVRGKKAIDLAFFATSTALFLRSIAKGRHPIQIAFWPRTRECWNRQSLDSRDTSARMEQACPTLT